MKKSIILITISILLVQFSYAAQAGDEMKAAQAKAAADKIFLKWTEKYSVQDHKLAVVAITNEQAKAKAEIQEVTDRIVEIEKEIKKRENDEGRVWLGLTSITKGLAVAKAEKEEKEKKWAPTLESLNSQLVRHQTVIANAANLTPKSIELGLARLETKHLLLENEQVKGLLDNSGLKIDSLYEKMNNTLLGQYSQYVAEQAIKKFSREELCEAVKKCSAVKTAKADIKAIKGEVKSFEQWKKEFEEQIKKDKAGNSSGTN